MNDQRCMLCGDWSSEIDFQFDWICARNGCAMFDGERRLCARVNIRLILFDMSKRFKWFDNLDARLAFYVYK